MSAVNAVHSLSALAHTGQRRWSHGWEAIQSLTRDRTYRMRGLLFQQLVSIMTSWGLHNPLLIGFGCIAMPPSIGEALYHGALPIVSTRRSPAWMSYINAKQTLGRQRRCIAMHLQDADSKKVVPKLSSLGCGIKKEKSTTPTQSLETDNPH